MTELADFLLARIAEDEAAATDEAIARVHAGTVVGGSGVTEQSVTQAQEGVRDLYRVRPWSSPFDPARVVAECKAKRLIIDGEPARWIPQPDAPGPTIDMATPEGMVRVYGKLITELEYRDRYMELAPPSQTLLYLALPYADHPDFREEWKP